MRHTFALAGVVLFGCQILALQPVPPPLPPDPVPVQPIPAPALQIVGPVPGFPPGMMPPGMPQAPKAAEPVPTPRLERPDGPPEFEARFIDESVVKVVILEPTVSVTTKYGKLTVPLADVLRVEMGFRFPDGVETKIEEAAINLGSPAFKDREEAEKTLLKYAEYSVPAVRKAAQSTDPEVLRRAEGLLKKLLQQVPAEKLVQKDYDLVVTSELTIRGRVEPTTAKVRTRLFGETVLKFGEVRTMRSTAAMVSEFTLEASRYARPQDMGWFDTGLDVSTDQPLDITANGTIDLAPGSPAQFTSGPGGSANQGFGPPITSIDGRVFQFSPGTLVGRVGPSGAPFAVGSHYKQTKAPGSGRLYLRITPSGMDASGNYKVKARSGG